MRPFRRSTPDPEPAPTAATMPDPVTDPQAFDAWVAQHAKARTQDDRPGTGIVNTGVMGNVQNNPGARGGHQTSNGRINRDRA